VKHRDDLRAEFPLVVDIVLLVIGTGLVFAALASSWIFPHDNHSWEFGYEMGQIAASLAMGNGFSWSENVLYAGTYSPGKQNPQHGCRRFILSSWLVHSKLTRRPALDWTSDATVACNESRARLGLDLTPSFRRRALTAEKLFHEVDGPS